MKLKQVVDISEIQFNILPRMAVEIDRIGYPLAIVAILKGGVYTAYELLKKLDNILYQEEQPDRDIVIGHIGLESYGAGMKSRGEVKLMTPLDLSREHIKGRSIVIVDDCVETGNTLREAKKILEGYDPKKIYTAVLVDKATLRKRSGVEKPDIIGWTYKKEGFLVGCGMGVDERYRELPSICEVVEKLK